MKIKLLIILLIATFFVYGQSTNRNYIGLSIGPSFPMGDFAKSELTDSSAVFPTNGNGFAKTGVALVVSYAYRITHNFGVQAMITYSSNSIDNIKYRDELQRLHPDWSVSVESSRGWSGGGIMVGPYLRFPFTENFSWDIRGLFGLYGSSSPKVTVRATFIEDESIKGEYFRVSGNDFSYCYSFGTGFKYQFRKYYLLVFADYLFSPQEYNNIGGWNWEGDYYTTTNKQNISYVYATVGLGYFF